jgi:CPA2 family monovalent cation:H+ antiporter-2
VIPEEFETSIELFDRVLSKLLIPRRDINTFIGRFRDDNYGIFRESDTKTDLLALKHYANFEISAVQVDEHSPVIGKSILEVQFRKTFSITLLALLRKKELYDNPDPETIIQKGDIMYMMGNPGQIASATELIAKSSSQPDIVIDN